MGMGGTLAEEAAWKFAKENGIDMVTIHPGWVIGPLLQPTLNLSVEEVLKLLKGLLSPSGLKDLWTVKGLKTCVCNYYPELQIVPKTGGGFSFCESVDNDYKYATETDTLSPLICAGDKPYEPTCMVSQEKTRSLGIDFTPLEVSLKDNVESLRQKNCGKSEGITESDSDPVTNEDSREMSCGEGKVVCVTGASGFIASWLVKLLLQHDYTVKATVRDPSRFSISTLNLQGHSDLYMLPFNSLVVLTYICIYATDDPKKTQHLLSLDGAKERLHLFKADLLEEGSFDSVVDGCDGVFHTASPVAMDVVNPQAELIDPALKGTINVLRSCAKFPSVKRVVVTSSMAAVVFTGKPLTSEVLIDESWFSDPVLCKESKLWYVLSKTLAEEAAWKFSKENGIDMVTINPAWVIGPLIQPTLNLSAEVVLNLINDTLQQLMKMCFMLCFLFLYLNIRAQTFPNRSYRLVDVRDVANAHIQAYEIPEASGRYCLVEKDLHYSETVKICASSTLNYPYLKNAQMTNLMHHPPGCPRRKTGYKEAYYNHPRTLGVTSPTKFRADTSKPCKLKLVTSLNECRLQWYKAAWEVRLGMRKANVLDYVICNRTVGNSGPSIAKLAFLIHDYSSSIAVNSIQYCLSHRFEVFSVDWNPVVGTGYSSYGWVDG
ncbi:Tetraketide alpha-pyrone reductase 1 [Vitis vinifera]|uniref:Tetraketide alpha-pyrone reductase 1 n=1 Tax=Vitis vinifera TaxID=29760 RepID=A0A438DYX8_VITVI|nr:Tetraketide alpha-pyrone reductase 1 [Vitis vinifera]